MMKVRRAVIPAAGFGTRFLPFTKSVPKELIPLVDKPVIQYVVEEAVNSGIEEILMVISSDKEAIIRHFNPVPELERRLEERGKSAILEDIRKVNSMARIQYVYQQQLNGLGDAVNHARDFAGDEPFALLLGDTVMDSLTARPVTGQLLDVFEERGASVVALEEVPLDRVKSYGIAAGEMLSGRVMKISAMIEKPTPEKAPSRLAFAARYVFTPEIFAELEHTARGKDGEIQLTDAMCGLLRRSGMYGCRIDGHRYDLGSKMGFLKATVEFGLRRPEFQKEFAQYIARCVQELPKEE